MFLRTIWLAKRMSHHRHPLQKLKKMTRTLKFRRVVLTERVLLNARKPNSGPKQRHSPRQDSKSNWSLASTLTISLSFRNKKQQSGSVSPSSRFIDISKMIFVDSQILNYSSFYPGKMLGSTLSVGNKSNCEQIVELSVDSANSSYEIADIKERFEDA